MSVRRRHLAVLAVFLSTALLCLAAAPPASANHLRRGAKTSLVGNVFHGPVPPRHIVCTWVHESGGAHPTAYRCTGTGGYRRFLSTPDGEGGLLQADKDPPAYRVANPDRFRCDAPAGATTPDLFACSYQRNGKARQFRLSEMVIMTDPDPNDPRFQGVQPVIYAWPPYR